MQPSEQPPAAYDLADAQTEWFVREVQRHCELGIPLGCCDEWPECSHVLDWYETKGRVELFAQAHGHRAETESTHCRYCGAAPANWHQPCTGGDRG